MTCLFDTPDENYWAGKTSYDTQKVNLVYRTSKKLLINLLIIQCLQEVAFGVGKTIIIATLSTV